MLDTYRLAWQEFASPVEKYYSPFTKWLVAPWPTSVELQVTGTRYKRFHPNRIRRADRFGDRSQRLYVQGTERGSRHD